MVEQLDVAIFAGCESWEFKSLLEASSGTDLWRLVGSSNLVSEVRSLALSDPGSSIATGRSRPSVLP